MCCSLAGRTEGTHIQREPGLSISGALSKFWGRCRGGLNRHDALGGLASGIRYASMSAMLNLTTIITGARESFRANDPHHLARFGRIVGPILPLKPLTHSVCQTPP